MTLKIIKDPISLEKIRRFRDDEKMTWGEIGAKLRRNRGLCRASYEAAFGAYEKLPDKRETILRFDEVKKIFIMRIDKRYSWSKIASFVGHNKGVCQKNYERVYGHSSARKKSDDWRKPVSLNTQKQAQRKCLKCGKMFDSHGPGNRMCEPCRKYADNVRSAIA